MAGTLTVQRGYASHETMSFKVLVGPLARLRGLLGTSASASAVALVRCRSIHTFGMRYRIDVAFLGAGGKVLEAWCSIPPGRCLSKKGALVTLERPHSREPWLAQGEVVGVQGLGGRIGKRLKQPNASAP